MVVLLLPLSHVTIASRSKIKKRAALASVLSCRVKEGRIKLIDEFTLVAKDQASLRAFKELWAQLMLVDR